MARSDCKQSGGSKERSATATRTERRRASEQQRKKKTPAPGDILYSDTAAEKTANSSAKMPGMMDKGSEYLGKGRSNGTKSPSNASNGHFSDESGSDDEHGEYSLEQRLVARVYVRVFNGRDSFLESNLCCFSC